MSKPSAKRMLGNNANISMPQVDMLKVYVFTRCHEAMADKLIRRSSNSRTKRTSTYTSSDLRRRLSIAGIKPKYAVTAPLGYPKMNILSLKQTRRPLVYYYFVVYFVILVANRHAEELFT